MKAPQAPRFEERRTTDFSAELRRRAQAWMPGWDVTGGERDFGQALLEIAARFNSEVAERIDHVGEKMRRGFLDWLAVRGIAARPSRVPVVFKLTDAAQEPVLASAPVQLQTEADGSSVVFETEKDLRVVPGRLDVVVSVNADKDEFYLPPPGLSDLKPLEPLPTQWVLKSYASAGATKLQLDPDAGLKPEMIIEAGGKQYRIVQVDNEIVTINPALKSEMHESTIVRKVTTFSPFDGIAINRQEHALCLGHMELLNIGAAATIEVVGATALRTGVSWQYWGKVDGSDEDDWQPLTLAPNQQQQPDAVVLEKKKGVVEPKEIDGKNSRWIRAFCKTVEDPASPMLQTDAIQLRVNCRRGTIPCPPVASTQGSAPSAEAMANTMPLVLDSVFSPLGKEPRQFDAFYLGSQEAFSKEGANVQLCFEMADPTFAVLSAIVGGLPGNVNVLAGVGKDRALHLYELKSSTGEITKLRGRDALQPPLPGYAGQANPGNTVLLDKQPKWRLPVWSEPDSTSLLFSIQTSPGLLVAVAAGDEIWVWREDATDQTKSGWIAFGSIPPSSSTSTTLVSGLVYLADSTAPRLAALRNYEMFVRERKDGANWIRVETKNGNTPVRLESIVPVLMKDSSGKLVTSDADGMVGIAANGELFKVDAGGTCIPLMSNTTFRADVPPAAFKDLSKKKLYVAAVQASPAKLVACEETSQNSPKKKDLPSGTDIFLPFEVSVDGNDTLHVLATLDDGAGGRLLTWAPFLNQQTNELFESSVGASGGQVGGAPTVIGQHVVIPGQRADVLISEVDLARRFVIQGSVEAGVVEPASTPTFQLDDHVASDIGTPSKITAAGTTRDEETAYPAYPPISQINGEHLYAFHSSGTGLTGDIDTNGVLNPTLSDPEIGDGMLLLVKDRMTYSVHKVSISGQVVKVSPAPGQKITAAEYWKAVPFNGRLAPIVRLNSANNNWDAAMLRRATLVFNKRVSPMKQKGKAFEVVSGKFPVLIALGEDWVTSPSTTPTQFVVDVSVGSWSRQLGDISSNPELSWEYWNGKGWWKLDITLDSTLNLKSTGAVEFKVPSDIASGDWAGKTNFWIRARLVGGDYGRETVTVETEEDGKKTKQTIHRSIEGIRPPSVVQLHISYSVCDAVQPTFVLAQDSDSMRDQSDANRTAGAIVEAFVPLALMVGRLSHAGSPALPSEQCLPNCQCHSMQGTDTGAPAVLTTLSTMATQPMMGRALFIGLDATVSGAQVNVLLLVEKEQDHSELLPLKVEALVADRFVPIVVNDGTRAVGESGLLSMTFADPPTRGELFGRTRTWLRLSPKTEADSTKWKPSLRGAYLNAVWATATETLTRELLGSSDGSPNLTLRVARPPVLHGTLELRVKEPLGDEGRATLCKDDAQRVLSQVQDLPGDWVLWKQVPDPGDEAAMARVYALDESTGEVRFGDGQHGMIPPIGRDGIVAFRYQRTEPPLPGSETVPGNLITPRSALNLVSSIESVEEAFAADQSAGGASPESNDRVLRFGFSRLRHRHRAVTLQDFEDLALESSPEIAQARCFLRRDFIRLVIVMCGKNPIPNAAQIRELHRLLTAVAPPALGEQGALRIVGPSLRRLRVSLRLQVESLDHAGALSEEVKNRLVALFDVATGGNDKDGWALGENPNEEDIALSLIDVKHLESLIQVRFREVAGNGVEQAWPAALKPVELVVLDTDPVRIELVTAEVMA